MAKQIQWDQSIALFARKYALAIFARLENAGLTIVRDFDYLGPIDPEVQSGAKPQTLNVLVAIKFRNGDESKAKELLS